MPHYPNNKLFNQLQSDSCSVSEILKNFNFESDNFITSVNHTIQALSKAEIDPGDVDKINIWHYRVTRLLREGKFREEFIRKLFFPLTSVLLKPDRTIGVLRL